MPDAVAVALEAPENGADEQLAIPESASVPVHVIVTGCVYQPLKSGGRPGATVTEDELKDWVRERLRSTKTPAVIDFRSELPYNETGKLLRRVLRDELSQP